MQFSPDRPAREVDAALRTSLEEARRAEGHAVLWFAEVNRRRLYRDLGFSSIYQYAGERLGFSRPRTAQFLRLAESMERLPRLRASLAADRTTWTKARTVARVALPRTEERWVGLAETLGRRDLEERVRRVLAAARRHRRNRRQARLALSSSGDTATGDAATGGVAPAAPVRATAGSAPEAGASPEDPPLSPDSNTLPGADALGNGTGTRSLEESPAAGSGFDEASSPSAWETRELPTPSAPERQFEEADLEALEVPVTVSLRMSPVHLARYEALVEKARKRGVRGDAVELALAGLEELVSLPTSADAGPRPRPETQRTSEPSVAKSVAPSLRRFPRGNTTPYEIHVAVCPDCERGRVATNRGERTLGLAQLRAAACDARIRGRDGVNRSTIPPRVRRQVLDRDGHRCQAAACGRTRFLEVHHRTPRSRGGSNRPENLVTLCSGCHRATHDHEPGDAPLRNAVGAAPAG